LFEVEKPEEKKISSLKIEDSTNPNLKMMEFDKDRKNN
jgi:hypothetical protein